MAITLRGDFIGFSFDGIRSENLGIVRTSDGSRYNEELNPTTQDATVQVPGGDGTYYFGSYHTQKTFSVPVAFDSLSESEFLKLKRTFATKGLHKLIFDEVPYKYYMVKCGVPQFKYLCFDLQGQRVYKGEGTLSFTAFYPYAKSVNKYLSDYSVEDYPSKDEWEEGSRMIDENLSIDKQSFSNKICTTPIYNAGDLEADFTLTLLFSTATGATNSLKTISLIFESEATPRASLILANSITKKGNDVGLRVNTKTNLIEGVIKDGQDYVPSGNLYNEYIAGGDFFKIPQMEIGTDLIITTQANGTKTYSPKWKLTYSADTDNSTFLEYNYIYY